MLTVSSWYPVSSGCRKFHRWSCWAAHDLGDRPMLSITTVQCLVIFLVFYIVLVLFESICESISVGFLHVFRLHRVAPVAFRGPTLRRTPPRTLRAWTRWIRIRTCARDLRVGTGSPCSAALMKLYITHHNSELIHIYIYLYILLHSLPKKCKLEHFLNVLKCANEWKTVKMADGTALEAKASRTW